MERLSNMRNEVFRNESSTFYYSASRAKKKEAIAHMKALEVNRENNILLNKIYNIMQKPCKMII